MSLSNEERLSGLYYAVENMVMHAKELSKDHLYGDLIKYCEPLWYSLLGKVRNGSHWIMGSSASNEITWGTISPWALGVKRHCDGIIKEKSEILESRRNPDYKKPFDAFENFLDIDGLLNSSDKGASATFKIFQWSEQAVYYLRRYDDEFLSSFEALSKVICDIQGECFKLFHSDEVYARAYILNILCKMIYGEHYPYQEDKWDSLTKYLNKDNIHHDLNRMMNHSEGPLEDLAKLHVKLHQAKKNKKLSLMMRTEAFMILAGRKYEYDHKFKELLSTLGKDVSAKDIKILKNLFENCKEQKKKYDDRSHNDYERDRESPLSIYDTKYLMD